MRISILLMGLFIFTTLYLSANPQTDWQKDGLQGKVKSFTCDYETTTYNPQGYIESFTSEFGDTSTVYTYDAKGRLISSVCTDQDGKFSFGTTKTYDASGLLITSEEKDTFGCSISNYNYNAQKQLTRINITSIDNTLLYADEYLYDSDGNNIRINNYEEDAKEPWSYSIFAYDKKNKLVEKRDYERSAGEQPVAVYKYDAEGLLTEETRYHKAALDTKMSVYYDKYCNVTLNQVYFAKSNETNITKFIYTYDKKGNWLTREEYRGSKLNHKLEREITYY